MIDRPAPPSRSGSRETAGDPFDLRRFVDAQSSAYDQALAELRQGCKRTHWIWFVLPQLRGLGRSQFARLYGLTGRQEAVAYLAHPVLGPRLRACVEALCAHRDRTAETMLGPVDALKFRSCLTLFEVAAPGETLFPDALVQFHGGERCARTLALLRELQADG